MITNQIQSADGEPKLIGSRATKYQRDLITKAAKLDNRSRDSFMLHSALVRAKAVIRQHNDERFLAISQSAGNFAISDADNSEKKVQQ